MKRHRVFIIFGIAWLSALLLSWWVYKKSTAPQQAQRDQVYIVAAARDLPIGKLVQQDDLKLIALERKDLPREAFAKTADVVERAVAVPVAAGEPLLGGKLAARGSGEGLTALIEPGTRAISVQVNEVTGVSGFIQPGSRVDVLFTRVFSSGDAATATILQNVKVIAFGKRLDPGAKQDPRDTSKPTVATVQVSQDEAQLLVLAQQRGRIQLALRNALDDQITDQSEPAQSADLGIEEPRKPRAAPAPVAVASAEAGAVPPGTAAFTAARKAKRENDSRVVVRVYRGEKVTEEKFP